MTASIVILAGFGLLLSVWALLIHTQYRRSMRYTPWCDFSEQISCSRAFTSKYSRTLRIHNSWFGIIAYPIVAWLAISGRSLELLLAGVLLLLASASLAYISFVKMRNYCVVCIGVYIVNIWIFLLALTAY